MRKKCLEVKLWLEKKLMMKFKELFLLLKTSFKVSSKNIYRKEAKKEKSHWLHADGLKLLLTMNPMGKLKNTMNKTLDNMTYLIDNKTFLCQHNKLHPLTARIGKWIPETLYREIASIVKNDSPNCGTPEGGEDLLHQELTDFEIDHDQYHRSDCSQSLCLEIKNKENL